MSRARKMLRALAATWPALLGEALGLGGAAAVTFGAWQVYPPAGWIAGGALALAAAWRLVQPAPEAAAAPEG